MKYSSKTPKVHWNLRFILLIFEGSFCNKSKKFLELFTFNEIHCLPRSIVFVDKLMIECCIRIE